MISQHAQIIRMLKKSPVHGVENYKFPQARILDYTARISELRQDGHDIHAERQIVKGRYTGVWIYHLIDEEDAKPSFLNRFRRIIS